MNDELNLNFLNNLNYVLISLEKGINEVNNLEDKLYLEISKSKIVNYLNNVYLEISSWKKSYEGKNYDAIINKYKEVESIISQLELCLSDYEDNFHMNGISYSIYQIGKILVEIKKERKNQMTSFNYEPIPTEKNIEFAFQKLLLAVVECANYLEYKETKKQFEKITITIINWISTYVNTKNLLEINQEEFNDVKEELFKLDSKYLSYDGLYAEEAYEWILQLEVLIGKMKIGKDGNYVI